MSKHLSISLPSSAIRLGRIARAEAEIIAEQVRFATLEYDRSQEVRLLNAVRQLKQDPAMAWIELRSFAVGLLWLRERWEGIKEACQKDGFWNSPALMRESFRLDGMDPDRLTEVSVEQYETVLLTVSCCADYKNVPVLAAMWNQKPAEWVGRYGNLTCPTAKARELVMQRIEYHIAEYTAMIEEVHDAEEASRVWSDLSSGSPGGYGSKSAHASVHEGGGIELRSGLEDAPEASSKSRKIQSKAPEGKLRNEPKPASQPPPKAEPTRSYVGRRFVNPVVPEVQPRAQEGAGRASRGRAGGSGGRAACEEGRLRP